MSNSLAVCRRCGTGHQVPKSEDLENEILDYGDLFCPTCIRSIPPTLQKACCDEFDYALGLRTGEILFFSSAEIHGEFVTITVHTDSHDWRHNRPNDQIHTIPFDRGLDIRLDDIVWCADAPFGS